MKKTGLPWSGGPVFREKAGDNAADGCYNAGEVSIMIRKATAADIPAVTAIYDALLDREEQGLLTTGWTRGVYPTEQTARDALDVDPAVKGRGYGTAFVRFYEALGRETGRNCLRIDTNARNTPARVLYARLGYTEAGIVAGTFNGIPGVQLVCLEKTV